MGVLEPIARLAAQFSRMPGIGSKSALKLAYFVVDQPEAEVKALAFALVDAKERVHYCSRCGNYTIGELCDICENPKRSSETLCVVCDPKDILALERAQDYFGRYHVLHGAISPMDGIGPDDIAVAPLLQRIPEEGVKEVILATNPDVEGEATASYIFKLLKPTGIRVTRIAHGVPIGGNLEYIDEVTLSKALEGRRDM